ncbi:DUF4936 family protein [Pelomicrobium sp. G1]|uniref:DUF4936 family protein n=1 Tax=unclassified Pelomicrobium TaxID=2815318 RepID=UPI003F75B1F2
MLAYYIYYRVDPAQAAVAEARVRELQTALDCRTGVAGRLLKKRDEPHLWMEVYEEVEDPARFEETLAQLVGEKGLRSLLAPGAERRVECFVMG